VLESVCSISVVQKFKKEKERGVADSNCHKLQMRTQK
jgi:hypothetical protein